MIISPTIAQTRQAVARARTAGKTIGLVPTMGALHEGHFSLIRRCREECGFTAVSIFVNPTQFGPQDDLDRDPRPFDADADACRRLSVDLIFNPPPAEMYPVENLTWINVEKLTEHLCGASRPGHFRGVCTVVAKLFHIVCPDRAYFGRKDAQQLAVIQRMVTDLNFPVEIVPCPTVRAPDGLALSSRNQYLSPDQRRQALSLYHALDHAARLVAAGQTNVPAITAELARQITSTAPGALIDYISIVDKDLLQPIPRIDRPALLALAVRIGPARLIDNILIDPPRRAP